MHSLSEHPDVFNDPFLSPQKRFILEIIRDLGGFNSTLEHFNKQLLGTVEAHLALSGRQRESLIKLIQDNGSILAKGIDQLLDEARFNIPGLRSIATAHFTRLKRNFDAIDNQLTAAESKTSFSTKERFVVLMYRLKRISDWHIARYLVHSDPEYRKIYRNLFAVNALHVDTRPAGTGIVIAQPQPDPEDAEALECIICHDDANSDAFLPVLESITEEARKKERSQAVHGSGSGIVTGQGTHVLALGERPADSDEEAFDSEEEEDFEDDDGYDEEYDYELEDEESVEDDGEAQEDENNEADNNERSNEDGGGETEVANVDENNDNDSSKPVTGIPIVGGKEKELPNTNVEASEVEVKKPTSAVVKVPGYGLTPCCRKPYHPFCLIPWTDRSETCPMCRANWEKNLDFQIEMHELRIAQIQRQLAEWDVEDLQEVVGSGK